MEPGTIVVAALEAPFTDEQRKRLGKVLKVEGNRVHVEWTDLCGWKTRVRVPRSWVQE